MRVTVDTTTLPSGLVATFDLDGGLDSTAVRTLAAGEAAVDVDFGYTGAGALGDFVWLDFDADGSQDAGEPGIPGVGVTVTWLGFDGILGNADDVVFGDVVTERRRPVPGDEPARRHVHRGCGSDDAAGGRRPRRSTADGALDHQTMRTLAVGQVDLAADFGYAGTGSVGDFVWLDIDSDGVQDAD